MEKEISFISWDEFCKLGFQFYPDSIEFPSTGPENYKSFSGKEDETSF